MFAPLRNLDSGATRSMVHSRTNQITAIKANMNDSFVPTRSFLEDIDLETRVYKETTIHGKFQREANTSHEIGIITTSNHATTKRITFSLLL